MCRKSNIHPHILLLSPTHITYIVVHLALLVSTSKMTRTCTGHNDVQLILLNMTVNSTPSTYLDDAGFESKPGDRLHYLRVSWSASVSPGKYCFKLSYINYPFITCHSYYNLSCCPIALITSVRVILRYALSCSE